MIISEESPQQTAFRQWVDNCLAQISVDPYAKQQLTSWSEHSGMGNADHLKQSVRAVSKLNVGSVRFFLKYFQVLTQPSANSKSREQNWRSLCVLVQKIILDGAETEPEVAEMLLLETIGLIKRYPFADKPTQSECKNLLSVYLGLLCLRLSRPVLMLELTLLIVKNDDLETELGGQFYKLDSWLSQRRLNFDETVMLFNIVSRGKLEKQVKERNYKWNQQYLEYRKLLPILICCLFNCSGADRDKFLIELTSAIRDQQGLLEVYIQNLNRQTSDPVIQAVFKYISWQMTQSISVKKVKLLLKCLKMSTPAPHQSSIQLAKLRSYVDILKDLSRRYPDACVMLNFAFNSSLVLEDYATEKQNTVTLLLELQPVTEPLALLSVTHKKGLLRFIVEPDPDHHKLILVVKLKEKILLREVIKIGQGYFSEFLVSICSKDDQVFIHVNSLQFFVKEPVDMSKIIVGNCGFEHSFTGRLKAFVMFSKQVNSETIYKDWIDCQCRIQALLHQKESDKIIVKMSRSDKLFVTRIKEKGFLQRMFDKEPKFTLTNTSKVIMSSFLQIVEQLGNLDCLLYFIEYINVLIPENPETVEILSGLFSILKMLCFYDQFYKALDWLERSLMSLGHLLWLIFTKNQEAARSVRLILKVFDFLLYFERRLKHQKTEESLATCYRNLECDIIKVILLNFDIWILCGHTEQRFVLKVVEKRLADPTILKNLQESNFLGPILLGLLVHYNPVFHTDNKILDQKAIIDLQNEIIHICSKLIRQQSPYAQQDFHTIILYIFVSQQSSLNYQCPTIFKQLLKLVSTKVFNLASIRKLLSESSSSIAKRLHLFFCRLIRNAEDPATLQMIIDINFQLMELIPAENQDALLHGMLSFLTVRSRESGLYLAPYAHILKRISNPKLQNLSLKLSRILADLRQCYKLVEKFQDVDHLEDIMMGLPQEVLIPLINSDEGFDFLLTVSVQQPQCKAKFEQLLQNLFVYCFSSAKPEAGLPFIRNFLKIFPKVDLPSSSPVATVHLICQMIDSKYLIGMLFQNKLVTMTPTLHFMIAAEELCGYPGGVLGHMLSRNTLSIEDIRLIKSLLVERPRRLEQYCSEQNLVQYFLPDLIFLQSLWTLLRLYMDVGLKRKLSLNSSRISNQSDKEEVPETGQILPEAVQLLQFMKDSVNYQSFEKNVSCFAKCEDTINIFYDFLNKQQTKENLLKAYLQMNSRLEHEISDISKRNFQPYPLLQQLSEKLKISNFEEAYKFIQTKRKDFEELLKLLNRYAKKDLILMKKVCFKPPNIELVQQLPSLPTVNSIYREEKANQMLLSFEQQFKTALAQLDNTSEKSQELWQSINNRNRFWLWDKKSENEVYKIDLHETPNFYHLNIKTAKTEHMAHYPRRNQVVVPAIQKKRPFRLDLSSQLNASSMSLSNSGMGASTLSLPPNQSTPQKRLTASGLTVIPVEQQEKTVEKKSTYYAEYVTQRGVYFGLIYLKENKLYFNSLPESDRPPDKEYQFSTSSFHRRSEFSKKRIDLTQGMLYTRRYIMRHTAVEIFNRKKSYFFNLFFEEKRRNFMTQLKDLVVCIGNRKQEFMRQDFTRKWLSGGYNNFEYLMLINRYSGRTYHDLSQFPVFPWVIANYSDGCKTFNKEFLKNSANLRNLQLPMGRLNEKRFEGFKQRMKDCQQDPDSNFLYGSFYSNPTFIYNFFIRLQPFTTLHWEHQGKKIDHADRLFFGIEQQYRSALVNSSDVRQCIPEFYYWPQFLRNRNQIQLGKKQNKQEVNNTKLPGWAQTPQQFIFKMRQALQSQQVTEQLAAWIDLIFGYKAPKEEATKYDNLFHQFTYEQDIFKFEDLDTIKMAQLNISEFGQVPEQLFTKEHPRKKPRHGIMLDYFRQIFHQKGAQKFELYPQGMMLVTSKQVFFINTNFSIVSKAESKSFDTISADSCLLHGKELSWVAVNDNTLYVYINKKMKGKGYKIDSSVYKVTSEDILVRAVGSQLLVQPIPQSGQETLPKPQKCFGHQQTIYKIVVNQNLDTLASIDRDQLVLVHYLKTLKCLRSFKLKLNLGENIVELRIHDMGYFVFLTSENRLLIYTYLGELFVQSDLATEFDGERMTNMQFFSEWQSLVLLSTTLGNIYQMDFFQLWAFKQNFAHLPFKLRAKKIIIAKCKQDTSRNQRYKDSIRPPILQFDVLRTANVYGGLFRIIVLYADGQLMCFEEKEMLKDSLENSPLLKQMGLV